MARESELEQAVSRMSVKCDVINSLSAFGGRVPKSQINALITLCDKVALEFDKEQRAAK